MFRQGWYSKLMFTIGSRTKKAQHNIVQYCSLLFLFGVWESRQKGSILTSTIFLQSIEVIFDSPFFSASLGSMCKAPSDCGSVGMKFFIASLRMDVAEMTQDWDQIWDNFPRMFRLHFGHLT